MLKQSEEGHDRYGKHASAREGIGKIASFADVTVKGDDHNDNQKSEREHEVHGFQRNQLPK